MFFVSCLLLAVGCRNKELLENELRTKEIQYRELLEEFDRAEGNRPAPHPDLPAPADPELPTPPLQGDQSRAPVITPVAPAGFWQPASLGDAVKLQRPTPFHFE